MKRKKYGQPRQFKPGELRRAIIEIILCGLVNSWSITRPALPLMIERITKVLNEAKEGEVSKAKIIRTLKNLEKKEIIDIEEKNGEVTVYLKSKTHPAVVKYSIKALLDFKRKNKKWEGKWFMVFFDVPEVQRNKRDYLRRYLYKLGFYRYQKSVYIFPYECEEEIVLIKKIIEGAKYMKYIIAEKIEDESKVKSFFKLK